MRFHRFVLCAVLMALSSAAFAQSGGQKLPEKTAPSEAQQAFETLKSFAGSWEGPVTVTPALPDMKGSPTMTVSMRVTSRGNAVVHEMQETGTPLDPTKYDHPVTMLYVDGDRLLLTHYCDAGNRPRMVGKVSPDGKSVEFDFVDLSGSNEHGHMHHAVFTSIDPNHHTEDWTYIMPGDKPMQAHFDLKRK